MINTHPMPESQMKSDMAGCLNSQSRIIHAMHAWCDQHHGRVPADLMLPAKCRYKANIWTEPGAGRPFVHPPGGCHFALPMTVLKMHCKQLGRQQIRRWHGYRALKLHSSPPHHSEQEMRTSHRVSRSGGTFMCPPGLLLRRGPSSAHIIIDLVSLS